MEQNHICKGFQVSHSHCKIANKFSFTRDRAKQVHEAENPNQSKAVHYMQKVESEFHFNLEYKCNSALLDSLFDEMRNQYKKFAELKLLERFIYLFTLEGSQALTSLGKFNNKSFEIRMALQNGVWMSCSVTSLETI